MMQPRDRLIVALDVPSAREARMLTGALVGSVGVYKLGLELLLVGGLDLVREYAREGDSVFVAALGSNGTKTNE